jgi:hypothetical protein
VPQKEWDKDPAAANAWIKVHLPKARESPIKDDDYLFRDRRSFEKWLNGQEPAIAVAFAVRSALRALPLTVYARTRELKPLVSATFRALAVALVVARHPQYSSALVAESIRANRMVDTNTDFAGRRPAQAAAAYAACAAGDAALAAAAMAEGAGQIAGPLFANDAVSAAALRGSGVRVAARAAYYAERAFARAYAEHGLLAAVEDADSNPTWLHIRSDVVILRKLGLSGLMASALWPSGAPRWAGGGLPSLRNILAIGEEWQVWFDWYEECQRGGSHGEAYELIFASVPPEEWDRGPAAANAWIKAHLPKAPETVPASRLPEPMGGLEAPFSYGWTASRRVAPVAGAQNLPFYPHFSSEEDHRRALEAASVGGERLLKALRGGRYNARPEYGEALEYYLDDLPKTAGAGNILLANDQVRILHAMFSPTPPCFPRASPAG